MVNLVKGRECFFGVSLYYFYFIIPQVAARGLGLRQSPLLPRLLLHLLLPAPSPGRGPLLPGRAHARRLRGHTPESQEGLCVNGRQDPDCVDNCCHDPDCVSILPPCGLEDFCRLHPDYGGGCHNLNVGECTRLSTDSGRVTATIFIKIVEG